MQTIPLRIEPNEFLKQDEIDRLHPKEAIAYHLAQQEDREPGSVSKMMEQGNGVLRFDSGHYVTHSDPVGGKGLLRIWEPGEYEAEKNKKWSTDSMGPAITKTPKEKFLGKLKQLFGMYKSLTKEEFKKSMEALIKGRKFTVGQTGTGKEVAGGIDDVDRWNAFHRDFSPAEHEEAASMHLAHAEAAHLSNNHEKRDDHMRDALEHMSRGGKGRLNHRKYTDLLDKFYK